MKKLLVLLVLAVTFAACKGPTGRDGVPGRDGMDGDNNANWATYKVTVNSGNWKRSGGANALNSYFYADVDLPELTNSIYNKGTVIGYLRAADDVKRGLPFVFHKGDVVNGKDYLWTQTYDFEFYPGGVTFNATYSDFITDEAPGTEEFYVVLMWK